MYYNTPASICIMQLMQSKINYILPKNNGKPCNNNIHKRTNTRLYSGDLLIRDTYSFRFIINYFLNKIFK